jgi:predicted transcriptional regulator
MLPERAYERIQELATANDVSAAWVMRQAILKFLEEHEGKRQLPIKSPGTSRAKSS